VLVCSRSVQAPSSVCVWVGGMGGVHLCLCVFTFCAGTQQTAVFNQTNKLKQTKCLPILARLCAFGGCRSCCKCGACCECAAGCCLEASSSNSKQVINLMLTANLNAGGCRSCCKCGACCECAASCCLEASWGRGRGGTCAGGWVQMGGCRQNCG